MELILNGFTDTFITDKFLLSWNQGILTFGISDYQVSYLK